jgi:hypothetical protein
MSKKFTLRSSPSPFQKQELSPKAAAAKKKRDKIAAMSEWGKKKKRDAQKKDCKKGYDYDHRTKKCVPASENRAGPKGGTKNEKTKQQYNGQY